MIVTDFVSEEPEYSNQKGFYMDGYLASNLVGIKDYLARDWDAVGIFSGHGQVRVGKSTLAFQVGTFVAWLLAGGEMDFEKEKDINGKEHWIVHKIKSPTKKINWHLKENVVFTARRLKERALELYKKYGKNQVIIYDEGRQGISASRAMETLNKEMEDFFQECGYMGHVILIVLPNFFKLHEDYAVSRSLFLIDVFRDKKKRRGYFNFYDEKAKEWLYFLGKKRIGISQKYSASNESFWGRFTNWFPFNREEYNVLKTEGLKEKESSYFYNEFQKRWKNQSEAFAYLLVRKCKISPPKICTALKKLTGEKLPTTTLYDRIIRFERKRKMNYLDDEDEKENLNDKNENSTDEKENSV
ncbi:MAG: hypothetical protein QXO70_01875 [Candidatus Pacearchaeota archaeon]